MKSFCDVQIQECFFRQTLGKGENMINLIYTIINIALIIVIVALIIYFIRIKMQSLVLTINT